MRDLHTHINGCLPYAAISQHWAGRLDMEQLASISRHCAQQHESLTAFIGIWSILRSLVQTQDDLRVLISAVFSALAKDKVEAVELRSTVSHYAKALNIGMCDAIRLTNQVIQQASASNNIQAGLILSFDRSLVSHEMAEEIAPIIGEVFRDGHIIAIDVTGNEDIQEHDAMVRITAAALQSNVPLTFHAGETGNVENIRRAVLVHGARRIGHATALGSCERTQKLLAERGVCVEVCVSSNVMTGIIKEPSEYPLDCILNKGIPFCVCTDNPALTGSTLLKERGIVGRIWGDRAIALSDEHAKEHTFL